MKVRRFVCSCKLIDTDLTLCVWCYPLDCVCEDQQVLYPIKQCVWGAASFALCFPLDCVCEELQVLHPVNLHVWGAASFAPHQFVVWGDGCVQAIYFDIWSLKYVLFYSVKYCSAWEYNYIKHKMASRMKTLKVDMIFRVSIIMDSKLFHAIYEP